MGSEKIRSSRNPQIVKCSQVLVTKKKMRAQSTRERSPDALHLFELTSALCRHALVGPHAQNSSCLFQSSLAKFPASTCCARSTSARFSTFQEPMTPPPTVSPSGAACRCSLSPPTYPGQRGRGNGDAAVARDRSLCKSSKITLYTGTMVSPVSQKLAIHLARESRGLSLRDFSITKRLRTPLSLLRAG